MTKLSPAGLDQTNEQCSTALVATRVVTNPPNPWASEAVEYLPGEAPRARLRVLEDSSRSVLSKNDSPDLGFDYTVNPYRGCFHGCAYCYARPTHAYLDLGAGTDFERILVVKPEAPALLKEAFDRPAWKGALVVFSGVTDCYQPLEASYRLTRACLEVCAEYQNPVSIVTKAPLVERDLDVLLALHEVTHLSVSISIPILDSARAHAVEPQVATPARRLRTIGRLAAAGIDVGINVSPFIPGLSEDGLRPLLQAAKDNGAVRAATTFLRLPGPVAEIFETAIRERLPLTAHKILSKVRAARGGRLNDPRFHGRMAGDGPWAQAALRTFEGLVEDIGLDGPPIAKPIEPSPFRRPSPYPGRAPAQLELF